MQKDNLDIQFHKDNHYQYIQFKNFAETFDFKTSIPTGHFWLEEVVVGRFDDYNKLLGIQICLDFLENVTFPTIASNGDTLTFTWQSVNDPGIVEEIIPIEVKREDKTFVDIKMYSKKEIPDTVFVGELHLNKLNDCFL